MRSCTELGSVHIHLPSQTEGLWTVHQKPTGLRSELRLARNWERITINRVRGWVPLAVLPVAQRKSKNKVDKEPINIIEHTFYLSSRIHS